MLRPMHLPRQRWQDRPHPRSPSRRRSQRQIQNGCAEGCQAATEEVSASAEVAGSAPPAEPVEEKKPEAPAAAESEANATAEVAGSAPPEPEKKPEAGNELTLEKWGQRKRSVHQLRWLDLPHPQRRRKQRQRPPRVQQHPQLRLLQPLPRARELPRCDMIVSAP
eukprot:s1762_g12.t4